MAKDDLFRSAEKSAMSSSKVLRHLTQETDQDLYAALAANVRREASGQRKSAVQTVHDDDQLRGRGAQHSGTFDVSLDKDDLRRDSESVALGERIFRRWSEILHEFLCKPGKEDEELRGRVMAAIVGKDTGATALITTVLVTSFGVSIPIAAVVAALVIRLIVDPAADEVCKFWGEKLGETPAPPAQPAL